MAILEGMTMEGLKLLLGIMIVVLGVAVTLIGYFMSKRDSAITRATENLTEAVEQLRLIVNSLRTQYEVFQPTVNERLKNHSVDIKDHESRIKVLETEHELFSCKFRTEK